MNNLEIIIDPINVPGIFIAKLWIKDGSRADPLGQKGAHQILSSLLNRGCGPYNTINLADLVEGCGAILRCDTFEDGILISLKCSDSDSEHLLPLLGWMINDPHLDEEQISLEKELTLQALQRQRENPFHLAFDGWRNLAYQEGPYGHDPLGTSEDLRKLKRENLLYLANLLKRRDMILSLAGTVNEKIKKQINELESFNFKQNESVQNPKKDIVFSSVKPTERQLDISLNYETTGQVVLMLGQPTISHAHYDDLALQLLCCHLGIGMSSLLFRRLREDNGVAYDVGIHHPTREEEAPFLLHASTSEDKALITLELLQQSWWELGNSQLSDEEFSLAIAKFRGQIALGSQTAAQRAERKAQLRSLNLSDDHDKSVVDKIKSISPQNLQEAALMHLQSPILSLCGPKKKLKELAKCWPINN